MKIGISGIGMGKGSRPRTLQVVAEHADRLGFGTLWSPEHVVLFDQYESAYPYTESGQFLTAGTIDLTDPFVTMSYVAARTKQIRLATGICLVPEHNPLELAKKIATVDKLSGGRVALGVGIGWSWEEFAALGIPFERRGERTCEYIEVMRKLWREEKTTFSGEFVKFEGVRSYPKPAQSNGVPIIFGGESVPALRRVARYGNGWFSVKLSPEALAAKLERLSALLKEQGRSLSEIELIVSPYDRAVPREELKRYAELGVKEVIPFVRMPTDEREIPAHLEQIAREWVEPAAAW